MKSYPGTDASEQWALQVGVIAQHTGVDHGDDRRCFQSSGAMPQVG